MENPFQTEEVMLETERRPEMSRDRSQNSADAILAATALQCHTAEAEADETQTLALSTKIAIQDATRESNSTETSPAKARAEFMTRYTDIRNVTEELYSFLESASKAYAAADSLEKIQAALTAFPAAQTANSLARANGLLDIFDETKKRIAPQRSKMLETSKMRLELDRLPWHRKIFHLARLRRLRQENTSLMQSIEPELDFCEQMSSTLLQRSSIRRVENALDDLRKRAQHLAQERRKKSRADIQKDVQEALSQPQVFDGFVAKLMENVGARQELAPLVQDGRLPETIFETIKTALRGDAAAANQASELIAKAIGRHATHTAAGKLLFALTQGDAHSSVSSLYGKLAPIYAQLHSGNLQGDHHVSPWEELQTILQSKVGANCVRTLGELVDASPLRSDISDLWQGLAQLDNPRRELFFKLTQHLPNPPTFEQYKKLQQHPAVSWLLRTPLALACYKQILPKKEEIIKQTEFNLESAALLADTVSLPYQTLAATKGAVTADCFLKIIPRLPGAEFYATEEFLKTTRVAQCLEAEEYVYYAKAFDFDTQRAKTFWSLLEQEGYEPKNPNEKSLVFQNLKFLIDHCQTPEDVRLYFRLIKRVNDSPSQELQRIKYQVVDQLLHAEDPEAAVGRIEDIFLSNRLPLAAKTFKVFETLYPPQRLERTLSQKSSPWLCAASRRMRYYTIYRDLLDIHIRSANPSLRGYLLAIRDGEGLLRTLDEKGEEGLTPQEEKKLDQWLGRMEQLYLTSSLGRGEQDKMRPAQTSANQRQARLDTLRQNLGLRPGQTFSARISDMFLKPLAYESLDQALEAMDQTRAAAHARNLRLAQENEGKINMQSGDLLKGIGDDKFIRNIFENGNVAKEFLGSAADSDSTPYDTDVSRVTDEDAAKGFENSLQQSMARTYGPIIFAFRDRGQFDHSTQEKPARYAPHGLELFQTKVLGERHYGVRTGIPTTEIDFIILNNGTLDLVDNVGMDIVRNGFYIPIVDAQGNILFAPHDYATLEAACAGLEINGIERPFEFHDASDPREDDALRNVMRRKAQDREQIKPIALGIADGVKQTLEELGIRFRQPDDERLEGGELEDTGSSGRLTNMPGAYDFDYVLRLDTRDMGRVPEIAARLRQMWRPAGDQSHDDPQGYQLRFTGVDMAVSKADIDIAFVPKNELRVYGSHEAVADRLHWTEERLGTEAKDRVVANIVLAKEALKAAGAYKKTEGGLGGIGVENWILANHGNAFEAFRSFRAAAYENGAKLDLIEFKKRYKILDPGINAKYNRHDNFIKLLDEKGYQAMLECANRFLAL